MGVGGVCIEVMLGVGGGVIGAAECRGGGWSGRRVVVVVVVVVVCVQENTHTNYLVKRERERERERDCFHMRLHAIVGEN